MYVPVKATSPVNTTKASASSFSFSLSSLFCACILRHGTTNPILLPSTAPRPSTRVPLRPASSLVVSTTLFFPNLAFLPPRTSSGWYWKVSRRSFWSRVFRRLRQTLRTAFVEKRCWYGDMLEVGKLCYIARGTRLEVDMTGSARRKPWWGKQAECTSDGFRFRPLLLFLWKRFSAGIRTRGVAPDGRGHPRRGCKLSSHFSGIASARP